MSTKGRERKKLFWKQKYVIIILVSLTMTLGVMDEEVAFREGVSKRTKGMICKNRISLSPLLFHYISFHFRFIFMVKLQTSSICNNDFCVDVTNVERCWRAMLRAKIKIRRFCCYNHNNVRSIILNFLIA